jgi:cell division protein FtsZ
VLGTSDQGTRVFTARRQNPARARTVGAPAASRSSVAAQPIESVGISEPEPLANFAAEPAAASSKGKTAARTKATETADQVELTFGEHETRGTFEKSDKNLFEGQDLDVPTYLRQGLKLHL